MRREETTSTEIELIEVEKINAVELFASEKVDPLLEGIAEKARSLVPDLSTEKSRGEIASMAYKVAQSKTALDKLRKALVADKKAEIAKVDKSGKYMRDCLDYLKAEVRQPLTEWEAEKARKEEEERLAEEARVEAERVAKEEADRLERERAEAELEAKRLELEKREAELKRQEDERKAKEEAERLEKERIEREERLRKEAAETAKREAEEAAEKEKQDILRREAEAKAEVERLEMEKIEAAERAEREKKEAIEAEKRKAKEESERKERELAQKQKEKEEKEAADRLAAERKAANLNHQKKINREALSGLIEVLKESFDSGRDFEETGKAIVSAIAKGQVPNVTINY